jgi:hypothetical protein
MFFTLHLLSYTSKLCVLFHPCKDRERKMEEFYLGHLKMDRVVIRLFYSW